MKDLLGRVKVWIHVHASPRFLHSGHKWTHMAYFGLVCVESHGLYGYAAGALFVLTLFDTFGSGGGH
jgi:hypothetical protein